MDLSGLVPRSSGSTPTTRAVGRLLAAAGADDQRAVVVRVGRPLGAVLREHPKLPVDLVETVLRGDDRDLLQALYDNPDRDGVHRDHWDRWSAADRPVVARLWYDHADLTQRRRILAAADPGTPGWTQRSGLVAQLLTSSDIEQLRPAVVGRFPDLIEHVLRTCHVGLSRADQLRAVGSLVDCGVLGVALSWLGTLELHPDVVELARAAATSTVGADRLRGLVTATSDLVQDTGDLVEELRQLPGKLSHHETRKQAEQKVGRRNRWDWESLRAAHALRPFPPDCLELLVTHRDCPADLAVQWCAALPRGLDVLLQAKHPIPSPPPSPLLRTLLSATTLTRLIVERLGSGLTGPDLLTECQPARTVLQVAHGRRGRYSDERKQAEWDAFRAGLRELVVTRLGHDVEAWRLLRTRLPRFNGTVTRLLDEVAASMAKPARRPDRVAAGPAVDWPDAAPLEMFFEPPSLQVNRAAFVTLLDAATTDTQWHLLPHLDERTRYDLLALGEWRDEWVTRVVADGELRISVPLARRPALPVEAIEALAALDDPATNFGLLYQPQATARQRHRLVNGIPFGPARTEPLTVNLDPDLDKVIAEGPGREYLLPLQYHDDPGVAQECVRRTGLPQNRMLRLIIDWWELDGHPNRILERLPASIQVGVRKLVTELVDAPDADEALDRLRAAAYEAESPKQAVRRMRGGTAPRTLRAEGFRWDWDFLVEAHREKPFEPYILHLLRALPGCPELLRDAALRAGSDATAPVLTTAEQRAHKALAGGKTPADVLAKRPVAAWVEHVVQCGDLLPVDVLRSGHPAREALSIDRVDDTFRTELAALVDKHLAGRPDAWQLVLAMLPDFAGTVPELLSTAALAAE
ncbi:hypothetical protein GCM10027280_33410 [Micromonospora polyrhachis]|uniref:Uncharacterized protein n=1 Tax=Micromonospora polyrhachis TaxID=1282883 RepID=A0A7W7SU48_9ACTN|nr:hypothetical protein [Micromonospora polyrhachis]MBB4960938.1 hypothetical protein [Micromonospora polyrhachis]